MKKKNLIHVLTLVLVLSLAGCSGVPTINTSSSEVSSVAQAKESNFTSALNSIAESSNESHSEIESNQTLQSEDALKDSSVSFQEKKEKERLNSFSMMYYLAITAEQIRSSKNNRLILDEIYTSLLNDINPGSVDEITQDHLKNLRDIIKSYLSISIKRERLQFIHNQNKASAVRSAVPNPLAILSMTQSFNWKKLAVSVVYSAVDSF